ncbi:hypothetical protein ACGLFO_11730, partial [Corynebacterium hesseae]
MSDTITIRGAVLERSGDERPYADSKPITVSELELTAPGEGEILVKITAAGLCHSDLSVVNNNRPRPLPMLPRLPFLPRRLSTPPRAKSMTWSMP